MTVSTEAAAFGARPQSSWPIRFALAILLGTLTGAAWGTIAAALDRALLSWNLLSHSRGWLLLLWSWPAAASGAAASVLSFFAASLVVLLRRRFRGSNVVVSPLTGAAAALAVGGVILTLGTGLDPASPEGLPLVKPLALLSAVAFVAGLLPWPSVHTRTGIFIAAGVLLVGASGALATLQLGAGSVPSKGATGPSLLLVTLDTFRADRVGLLSPETAPETPTLNRLGKTGTVFTRTFSVSSITGPTHASILTGLSPLRTRVTANGVRVPDNVPTLAEHLRRAGYSTGGFVSAAVLDSELGFHRGFDVYDDRNRPLLLFDRMPWRPLLGMPRPSGNVHQRPGEMTIAIALDWIRRQEGPFFAWVHLYDAHQPYTPPAELLARLGASDDVPGRSLMPLPFRPRRRPPEPVLRGALLRYNAEVMHVDALVASLLSAVDTNTVVSIVADHGESLTEHEYYFAHGRHLYDELTWVPWLLTGPGVPAGARVDALADQTDVTPTLMGLLGVTLPTGLDGRDLSATLGPLTPAREHVYSVAPARGPGLTTSIRTADARLVLRPRGQLEAYDMLFDPEAAFDLGETGAVLWPDLHETLQELSEMARAMPEPERPGALRDPLRALGYVN